MGDIAGTIRKLMIKGISFDVMADADVTETPTSFLNEPLSTSGRAMRKMTKRVQSREGLVIACNPQEQDLLKGIADSAEIVEMSYTKADNSVYRATGFIEFESVTTMENRGTIKLHPTNPEGWRVFGA